MNITAFCKVSCATPRANSAVPVIIHCIPFLSQHAELPTPQSKFNSSPGLYNGDQNGPADYGLFRFQTSNSDNVRMPAHAGASTRLSSRGQANRSTSVMRHAEGMAIVSGCRTERIKTATTRKAVVPTSVPPKKERLPHRRPR